MYVGKYMTDLQPGSGEASLVMVPVHCVVHDAQHIIAIFTSLTIYGQYNALPNVHFSS